ncbi:cytochrome c maturation protein CcmE [Selenomonas sp. TAMA-11512]|uniref:cytochrome c maturation protein CcmE domain-containing protein n=1 Tax=Selenomonas sp. TAMA-11512 TaxID=3095337 RepID=UPI00308D664E|nr:cytochrome c maturation protein CcmE [Selenomonas sp. TAMA-11512]
MKRSYLLIGLIVLFAAYAGFAFSDSVTPYVSIADAKTSGDTVQVKGLLAQNAPAPAQDGKDFVFTLEDESGGEMLVRYHGTEPDQFKEAHHIVAIGHYEQTAFEADKLLIKCPSKYERQK